MISGRRAIDTNQPSGEHFLVEWAKPYLSNKRRVFHVMDPRLEGYYSRSREQQLHLLCNVFLKSPSAGQLWMRW